MPNIRTLFEPLRRHAWSIGLLILTIAILVVEAPRGVEDADALSVRPYADNRVDIKGAPGDGSTAQSGSRSTARVEAVDKALAQRPTIRT